MVSDWFGSLYHLSYCHVNCDAPTLSPQISMSVRRTPVPVMKMQIAIIRTVPTAVPVDRDSPAMEQLVMVNLQKILVSTSQSSMFWNCSHENMLRSILEINL